MATGQTNIAEAIAQAAVEETRRAVQAMAGTDNRERTQNAGPKIGGFGMKTPTFNWEVVDKHSD